MLDAFWTGLVTTTFIVINYVIDFLRKRGVYLVFVSTTLLIVFSFITYILSYVLKMFNLIVTLLDKSNSLINNNDESCISSSIYYLFECIGLLEALRNIMPIVLSSITFLLLVILGIYLISLKKYLDDIVYKTTN